jgi:hypothetical protein
MLNNIHQCLLHAQEKDQTIAVIWVQGIRKFMQGIHAYAEQSHQINWQVLQILTQGLCNETPSNLSSIRTELQNGNVDMINISNHS